MKVGSAFTDLADAQVVLHGNEWGLRVVRILLAEDELSFQRLLEEKLSTWGYDVVVAVDGIAALQILQSEDSPRIAILRLDDAGHGWGGNMPENQGKGE